MATFEHMFTASLDAVNIAVAELSAQAPAARRLDDDALMSAQTSLAAARRQLDATASLLAGEMLARSAVEAGHRGLAQKTGFRTPQALIQHLTGATSREASTLVRVGSLLNDASIADQRAADGATETPGDPEVRIGGGPEGPRFVREAWLVSLGAAVAAGTLSVAGAEAIRSGLGAPTEQISEESLANAASRLVTRATAPHEAANHSDETSRGCAGSAVDPDILYRWAREAREAIDADGIRDQEHARRAARSFRRWRKPDGMTRYTWELDPEGAAFVDDVYDQLTSPRGGGPRFTRDDDRARAEAILRDERTTDQLASDGVLELLRIGADTAPTAVVGVKRPAVRVLVTEPALRARAEGGHIEGHPAPVSIETVERHICESGTTTILFDTNQWPIDVGREQRLFTSRQRTALAARDGGCRAPGCDRPPSWTEAHHIEHWQRDGGRTDLDNGILLCRHHHLLFHDQHWEITRRDDQFWLIPPAHIDSHQTPRLMPSKSAALHELSHQQPSHQPRQSQARYAGFLPSTTQPWAHHD